MPDQSLRSSKFRQSLKQSRKNIIGKVHNASSGSKLLLWLSLSGALIVFGVIIIISQAGKSQRVYDNTIFIRGSTKSNSNRDIQPEEPPKENNSDGSNPVEEHPEPESSGNLESLIRQIKPSVVFVESVDAGQGSGFIISGSGYILTCHHVIARGRRIVVTYFDAEGKARRAMAEKIWSDEVKDIALIRADVSVTLTPMKLGDAESISQGHQIMAVGYPLGSSLGIEPTVTKGIVSSIRWLAPDRMIFQIDAPVNPGNSGGALISIETGQAIGIVGAKAKEAEGIGFAIPITKELKDFLYSR